MTKKKLGENGRYCKEPSDMLESVLFKEKDS